MDLKILSSYFKIISLLGNTKILSLHLLFIFQLNKISLPNKYETIFFNLLFLLVNVTIEFLMVLIGN